MLNKYIFALALFASTAAEATSMKDFWQSRPEGPRFTSAKSSLALEMCLGMEMSELAGAPNVLHGERETVLTSIAGAYQSIPVVGVRILEQGTSRQLVVGALQKAGWTNKISAAVQRCM